VVQDAGDLDAVEGPADIAELQQIGLPVVDRRAPMSRVFLSA
jgi:hypothetical protein